MTRIRGVLAALIVVFGAYCCPVLAQFEGPESFHGRIERLFSEGRLYEARKELKEEYYAVLELPEADPYRRAVVANYVLSTTYRKDMIGQARGQLAELAEYPDQQGARARLNLSILQEDPAEAWRMAKRAARELEARQAPPEMVALAEIWVISFVGYDVEVRAVFEGDARRSLQPQIAWEVDYPKITRRAAEDLHRHLAVIAAVKDREPEMYAQAERLCQYVEGSVRKLVSRKRDYEYGRLSERLRNHEFLAAVSAAREWRERNPETVVTLSRGEGAYAYHMDWCETIEHSRIFRVKERVAIVRYDRRRCQVCVPKMSRSLPTEMRTWWFDGEEYLLLPFLKEEKLLARYYPPGSLKEPVKVEATGSDEPQLLLPRE